MSDTKVFSFPESGGSGAGMLGYLAPLLRQNGLDPNMVFAMMNGNRGNNNGFGDGAWFLWIIVILALFRNGFGFGGNNGGMAEQACNSQGCGLLANYLATGNQTALAELSNNLHCDVNALQTAINSVMASIQNVGNQVGMSGQQVINAIQLGNSNIASQLASCCCDIRESIAAFKGDLQLQLCQQTNALTNSINNVATGQERGFSSVAYETQRQTCDLQKSIADSTAQILAGQKAAEFREIQREVQALRDERTQYQMSALLQQQSSNLINTIRPCPIPSYPVCNPWAASNGYYNNGYPYAASNGYPYAANNGNGGCNCGVGY